MSILFMGLDNQQKGKKSLIRQNVSFSYKHRYMYISLQSHEHINYKITEPVNLSNYIDKY